MRSSNQKSNDKNSNFKLVCLQKSTYDRLRQYGRTPDSFNDIINRLLDGVSESRQQTTQQQVEKEIIS
jgi:hypothetical protein